MKNKTRMQAYLVNPLNFNGSFVILTLMQTVLATNSAFGELFFN